MSRTVSKLAVEDASTTSFDPAVSVDLYKAANLSDLGFAFFDFEQEGQTQEWKIGYEEVLYVVSGRLTLIVSDQDGTYSVSGGPGAVLTIGKGSAVSYGGTAGTRAFASWAPLNWQDLVG